jgi:hypothetical protein
MSTNEWLELLGNLGEFLGSIGVLATLLYLAVQVRQANRVNALAAVQANRAERRQGFLAMRDSAYWSAVAAKIRAGEPLSTEEELRVLANVSLDYGTLFSEWVNRDIGLITYGGIRRQDSSDRLRGRLTARFQLRQRR